MSSRCESNKLVLWAVLVVGCFGFHANQVFGQAGNQSDHAPAGWFLAGSKPAGYRTGVDAGMIWNSLPSAYLISKVKETGGFGTLMQTVSATAYAGKRVRLRAWVRTDDVTDWTGLWMRIDKRSDKKTETVGFDNMQQRAIHGSQPWAVYDVVLDVPADATWISFGTLLAGTGAVWINDVKLEAVGQEVATTGVDMSQGALPKAPVNLDFQKN
jgi:hypothetical protein